VATEEELAVREMHTSVSGLGEYLAQDDRQALGIAREVVRTAVIPDSTGIQPRGRAAPALRGRRTARPHARQPARAGGHARGHRAHRRRSELLEFKPLYGAATVCAQAAIGGHAVGFITNNGPIDVAGANKATHFIQ
jgi:geranyl-CoA carboxylase beta subunit